MILRRMLSRAWILTTLLVVAGGAVCIRLGIWQLDRLAQRRAFNAHVNAMREASMLDLNSGIPADILDMEWRAVTVTGIFDSVNAIALRNEYQQDQIGYDLIEPLQFDGGAVFVDRGWIPADGNAAAIDWRQYDVHGAVTIVGQIRLSQPKPFLLGVADPPFDAAHPRLDFWNNLDLPRIASQISYAAIQICIQPNVTGSEVPPIPSQPELDLTEGPHFGYAMQWFGFAAVLLIGYPIYLRRQKEA